MDVNAIAPLVVTQYFLPLLKKSTNAQEVESAIVFINSATGSIADNKMGSKVGHFHTIGTRMSKAAQNQVMRTLSVDLKKEGILSVSLVPGWVQTEMGGRDAPTTVLTACAEMVSTIVSLSWLHNGQLLTRKGQPFPF